MNCIFLQLWLLCMAVCEFWVPGCSSVVGCGKPESLLNGKVTLISGTQNQHGSIIQYHCNEPFYSLPNGAKANFKCSLDGKWKDVQRNSLIPQCIPVCGRPTVTLPKFGRIIGGKDAPPNSFPWHVFLTTSRGRGGGMVIGDYWIMTAATVLYGITMETVKVYVGVNNLNDLSNPLEVSSIHLHPKYNSSEQNYDHDIGLIHLKHLVTFNTNVMPLCLPTKDSKYTTGQNGLVSGFGSMENDMNTDALRYVPVPVVDQEKCRSSVDMAKDELKGEIIPNLTENMFCAGKPEGGKDTCQGDSGGPFILKEKEHYWAAGIVSWGIGCGEPNRYGVYTRVANYIDWINKTIEEEEQKTIKTCEFWIPGCSSVVGCGQPEPLLNGKVTFISGPQNQQGSIIQYHCNEPFYSLPNGAKVNFTCSLDGKWKDDQRNSLIPQCIPVCGRPTVTLPKFGRIIGGKDAPPNSFPWHVFLKTSQGSGGGMVIGHYWIMTAATVLYGNTMKTIKVYVGVNNLNDLSKSLEVSSIYLHPKYNGSEPNYDHDIGLIHLKHLVTYNTNVMPLCLPTKDSKYTTGQNGLVSGFGTMENDMNTDALRYVPVPVVDQERCRRSFDMAKGKLKGQIIPNLTENMFCAGKPEGGKDACQGDCGGPFILKENEHFWAAGIVSWGIGCGEPNRYGVYTRVANYIDWINKTIDEEEQRTIKTCPGIVTSNSTMTPQQNEYRHGDTVTVTCDTGSVLNTGSKEYESTCQRTGGWSPVHHCEPIDCGEPDTSSDEALQLVDPYPNARFLDEVQFKCESIYYKLEGDEKYICDANGTWISVTGQQTFPKCIAVCGTPGVAPPSYGRVIGGRDAALGEIPWQILTKVPKRGGASLISDCWAVTTASLVDGDEEGSLTFYGGLIDGLKAKDNEEGTEVMHTKKIIIHPKYVKGIADDKRTNYDHDIALLRMSSRVKLGPNVLPICLPEANGGLKVNQQGSVSGWGSTESKSKQRIVDKSQWLRHAPVGRYPQNKCEDTPTLPTNNEKMVFTENMFCAGADGKDSCRGDSGVPLFYPMLGLGNKDKRGPYRLVGIVSWGSPCDSETGLKKGYYTKVENYLDWIKETIMKEEQDEEQLKHAK
ncbi:hypothetical protein UPYG_G00152960 [Umbra pygmaea]|uniref:Uncharacterized protein n=1 Tax=Umbra pygmaea TaxID=75934 RepID=A0ABD0WXF1_UMBPY